MYIRKILEPRMDPWGTPALTGYSWANFPLRTNQTHILLRNEETRPNIWLGLKFVTITSMPNSVKSIGYIKWYTSSSPRSVISPSNSIKRSAVDGEDLKPL